MRGLHTHSHWLDAARELRVRGEDYVLVTVLSARGSTPRDGGSKMVFSREASYGSIGGGHLEYQAAAIAAELMGAPQEQQRLEYFPLGPKLGQCCGGSAHLLFESFKGAGLNIALFGAGHVGQALVPILAQLPCRIQWVDSRDAVEALDCPANVSALASEEPHKEVSAQPPATYYVIMTHNHQQDFDILRAVLRRGDAGYVGLIGSVTKWRRFQMRLEHHGHTEAEWQAVRCPVGLDAVPGKLPVEVAVSVAGEIIAEMHAQAEDAGPSAGTDRRALKTLMAAMEKK
ncbi:MAG: xanthine dehydrogenase accessory protein XdhC [Pseudomonadota bacterium]